MAVCVCLLVVCVFVTEYVEFKYFALKCLKDLDLDQSKPLLHSYIATVLSQK